MFHFDRGIRLTRIDLGLDVCRRLPRGYISHAHGDHMARHELAFCTPDTGALYQYRLGKHRVKELPYRQTVAWQGTELTTYPAGHMLGSALLLAEDDGVRLLFSGDFKLGDSATAERAEVPTSDVLIMESTFGDPAYRLPARSAMVQRLVDAVQTCFSDGVSPVIYAYAMGKSQEVTRLLRDHGIAVYLHPHAFAIAQVYVQRGCDLGGFHLYQGPEETPVNAAIIVPPQHHRAGQLPLPAGKRTISVTGWAAGPQAKYRMGVDYAIPLSDHADFSELIEFAELVNPTTIYCTHGPVSFVQELVKRGHDARPLE